MTSASTPWGWQAKPRADSQVNRVRAVERSPSPMTIDVVVVTWQQRDLTLDCLRHLAQSTVPARIIVVDNASSDGTLDAIRSEFPDVDVLPQHENLGFAPAVNIGAAAGCNDVVVLVNNDVEVEPEFLEHLVAPLDADPTVGMVAGLTVQPGGELIDQLGISVDRGLAGYLRGRHTPIGTVPGDRLLAPCGCAAAYRRTAWEQAGGFDPVFFAYGEEFDLGLRIRQAGWGAVEAPLARGVHLGGATTGVDSPMQRELSAFARGFILGRYRGLNLQAVAIDAAVVAKGLLASRSAIPLRGRLRGWRAGRRTRRAALAPELIEPSIGLAESLRRLRSAR